MIWTIISIIHCCCCLLFVKGGCGDRGGTRWSTEEENVQEVQLSRRGSRCALGHVHRWTRQALLCSCPQKVPLSLSLSLKFHSYIYIYMLRFGWFFFFYFRFQRGLTRKPMALIKKLRKAVSYYYYYYKFSFWFNLIFCFDYAVLSMIRVIIIYLFKD